MDNQAKATPRPWKIQHFEMNYESGECNGVKIVSDDNGDTIADNQTYYPKAITKANASLIVKAVNNHEALIDACRLALNTAYALCDYATEVELREAVVEKKLIETLRQAIANAEGR